MRPLTQILKKASGGQRREEYQSDAAFTPGILAFTRVITADITGVQVGSGPPATEVGQILDADIYFDPASSMTTFATPAALPSNPAAYDLESLIIHELGHTLGFSHSAVWNAMMYPFAPATGTFTGAWPTAQQLDAPLGDDDRAGLRVLYPDANDTVVGAALGGWSCTAQGRRNSTARTESATCPWAAPIRFTPNRSTTQFLRPSSAPRQLRFAAIPLSMPDGRRCNRVSCHSSTPALPRVRVPDRKNSSRRCLYAGANHPPPNSSPGPSDARKIGPRAAPSSRAADCSKRSNATPHVDDPRLPNFRATVGNFSSGNPHCRASSATSRGLG